MGKHITHQDYVRSVQALLLKHAKLSPEERIAAELMTLSYSISLDEATYGVTFQAGWKLPTSVAGKLKRRKAPKGKKGDAPPCCNHTWRAGYAAAVGIIARGDETPCQLATTVAHEMGHAIVGPGHGHDATWRAMCERLGMHEPRAAGKHVPGWEVSFVPEVAAKLAKLPLWTDGQRATLAESVQIVKGAHGAMALPPALQGGELPPPARIKPCGAGFGTRGGTSRGKGSGSRWLAYRAEHKPGCEQPRTIRCPGDKLTVSCDNCKAAYKLDSASLPPSHGQGQSGQGVPAKVAREHGARKPLAKPKPKPKPRKSRKSQGKAGAVPTPRVHAKPKPAKPAKRQRVKVAQAAQAPLPPEPAPAPEPIAGQLGGVDVVRKPEAKWCEACNTPATMCTRPAGECVA